MLYLDSPELGKTLIPVYRNLHRAPGIRTLLRLHERGHSRTILDFDPATPDMPVDEMKVLRHYEFLHSEYEPTSWDDEETIGRVRYMSARNRYPNTRTVLREHHRGFSWTKFKDYNPADHTRRITDEHHVFLRTGVVKVDSFGHTVKPLYLWHGSEHRYNMPSLSSANERRGLSDRDMHDNGGLGLWCSTSGPKSVQTFGPRVYRVIVDAHNVAVMDSSDLKDYRTAIQVAELRLELLRKGVQVLMVRDSYGLSQAVVIDYHAIYSFEEGGAPVTQDLTAFVVG